MKHKISVKSEKPGVSSRGFSAWCKTAANTALKTLGIGRICEIFILITDNDGIRRVNFSQRGLDKPTDVLSFPMLNLTPGGEIICTPAETDPDTGAVFLGDIVISTEKMKEQAEEYGHSEARELSFLVVHAVLHLLGYDHENQDDETLMCAKQEEILKTLNLVRRE